MASDTTRLTIELELLLRNLNRTLRGLSQVEQRLRRVASIKVSPAQAAQTQRAQLATERLALAQQRLALQQQRLQVATQQAATAQGRAATAAGRLALAQQRLAQAQQRATQAAQGLNVQQDAHVRAFRAMQHAAGQFNRTLTALGNSLRSVGQGLASFGATLSLTVSAPLAALAVSVVDAAVRMDSLRRGLDTIAGSSQEAARQLVRLTEIAKLPGIGFEEAIQGSIALQAVGFSAAEAEKALIQFSNAVALTGGSREQLQAVTVQLGQMAAQSKVLAADLKPIINAAPAVAVALRNAFGTVRSEEIQELGIQSKEFIDIMIKELAKLPRAAAGARNSFDNFRDTVFRAAATIGETLLPALVRLADTFGPIVTGLANAFAALPVPIQSAVLVVGALTAALGPLTFVFGQLVLGLGRVIVGFAQLNALGLLPSIANFRLLGQVMIGTASLAQGAAATAAAAAVGWATLAGAVIGIVGLVAAIVALSNATKEEERVTREQVQAAQDYLDALREEIKFVEDLETGVKRTTDEQQRLKLIYEQLNAEAKARVAGIEDETFRLAVLRAELQQLIKLRQQEQFQQAANLAAQTAANIQLLATNEQSIQSITRRIAANNALVETLQREGKVSLESGKQLARFGVTAGGDVRQAVFALQKESAQLVEKQTSLRDSSIETEKTVKEQAAVLRLLQQQTGLTGIELLAAAKNMGVFRGDVHEMLPVLEQYIKDTDEAAESTERFNAALSKNAQALNAAGDRADRAQKARQAIIASAAAVARETSVNFEGALKSLRQMVDAVPELATALKRESELTGKSLEELLRSALDDAFKGRDKPGAGGGLRNAQQQLADAILQVALASGEREVEVERDKNAALLQAAETGQRLRLISYREYLQLRANLTAENLDKEIGQQQEIVKAAQAARVRLLAEARKSDLPAAERTRRQAQAAQAEEEAIRAETRLIVLRRQRERIDLELAAAIRESQDQQLADTRQLEIHYAELQGRVEDALNAAAVEEFREQLEELAKAQDFLNQQIELAKRLRQTDLLGELERARNLNQRQIDAINNTIRQRSALAELAAAEKLVENAKERQRKLEEDLRFQVEFRGLSEEEAIQRRLEGEQKLAAILELSKSIIADLQQRLTNLGFTPPPELQKFIDNLKSELLGLGELSFTEQFRLREKEFQRLNDERLRRIADIERAVNNRNISEAEGLLLIRRINGEYVGDLERQLELLKQIAAASGDANLQRQAQTAEETVKDAGDRLADFDKQLRSTAIDSLRSSFIDFFVSLRDNSVSAQEKLLNLIDGVVDRINEVIAERLFDELIESIFGDGTTDAGGGIIAAIKRLFGFGGGGGKGAVADVAGKAAGESAASTALTTGAAAAATTLQTGATTAAATQATAATGFAAAITAAAAGFAATITAAGAAFAATIGVGATAQAATGGVGSLLGAAETGLFPAVPGGVYKFVEGGHPEAVLTTDPKHAQRQVAILRAFLRHTKGLGGRIREFAAGAFISPHEAQSMMLSGVAAPSVPSGDVGQLAIAGTPSIMRLRQVLVDQRSYRDWLVSSEGEEVVLDILRKNQPTVRNLSGGGRR